MSRPRSSSPLAQPDTAKRARIDAESSNLTEATANAGDEIVPPAVTAVTENEQPHASTSHSSSQLSRNGKHAAAKSANGKSGKGKQRKIKPPDSGGMEEVMFYEAQSLLGVDTVATAVGNGLDYRQRFDKLEEIELDIVAMSSHGEGIGITLEEDWIVAVPFCVPGERVSARVYRNDRMHSYADLVKLLKPASVSNTWRNDTLVRCKYFGTCSGCQYQMLSYEMQLQLKQEVVAKAYRNFSKLASTLVPAILPTLPSPRQYAYRTKLTPHFDTPTSSERKDPSLLKIGFQQKGRRAVMDIEECPIGTHAINVKMREARNDVRENLSRYKRAATLLLRDSLPIDVPLEDQVEAGAPDHAQESQDSDGHVCITDHHAVVRERVSDKFFTFTANSFFQNNNGILQSLVESIRELLPSNADEPDRFLVDAYCGSGLFAITLAERFQSVAGIEISADSIKYAKLNAELNNIKNVTFLAGSAEAIFEGLTFPSDKTTVLIDPPRKGCDEAFLKQLLAFSPKRIIYVSCNVHTQARDVGYIVRASAETYKVDSIRGCDLFPQTYHVEGLAVLSRR